MTSHRVDHRTCCDRVENQIHQWGIQMSKLVDAYLDARTCNDGEGMPKMSDQLSDPSVAPLLRHSYIGCSPVHPTLAISLRTLAAYHQSHRACPRFSIGAQCKMLSHMHNVCTFWDILISFLWLFPGTLCPLPLDTIFGSLWCVSWYLPTSWPSNQNCSQIQYCNFASQTSLPLLLQ
jgi:hypothetical protein